MLKITCVLLMACICAVSGTVNVSILLNESEDFSHDHLPQDFASKGPDNFEFKETGGEITSKSSPNSVQEFWSRRNAIADLDTKTLLGSRVLLKEDEIKANKIVLSYKYEEYGKALDSAAIYPPAVNFLQSKTKIEQAEIFKIIRKIPKGASLANILEASVPLNFIYRLTFDDSLYVRLNGNLQFRYSKTKPGSDWRLLSEIRDKDPNLKASVENRLSLNQTGEMFTFRDLMHVYRSLISYKPNLEKWFKKALETLYEDNLVYAEFYYDFPQAYDLNGRKYEPLQSLEILKNIMEEFTVTHGGFIGARFIYGPLDRLTAENLPQFRKTATELWRRHPNFLVGFAVIRLEENEEPYNAWVEEYLKFPKDMKLFLDAALTANWGTDTDYELYDAIALNSVCIAGGFSIPKHPAVLQEIREKDIFVKSSPLATQVFLLNDLRLHPLTVLVALDLPIVVVSVAGAAWNATGISYDWYDAYMAMTPRFCDLRCLKQFAINSLTYAAMSMSERRRGLRIWKGQWNKFIKYIENNYEL